jgi:hypothetical protein
MVDEIKNIIVVLVLPSKSPEYAWNIFAAGHEVNQSNAFEILKCSCINTRYYR